MDFKVEVRSKEMIKPSSPTPHHLKTLKLSFLDQMAPPIYATLIFFYQTGQEKAVEIRSLKHSLSDVLSQFYPLAGRLVGDKLTITCNDSGVLLVETKIQADLREVIRDPDLVNDSDKFVPLGRFGRNTNLSEDNTVVLAVQFSLFDDGGIAIAAQMHHNAMDSISLANFMNAWAAVSRGGCELGEIPFPPPTFGDLSQIYPPRDMSHGFKITDSIVTKKIVTKLIVFNREQLEKLRMAERKVSQVKDATRVEALSAYFLRHFKEIALAKGSKKPLAVTHAVNLRPRMNPPLPHTAFGNLWMDVPMKLIDDGVEDLVGVLRKAINKSGGGCYLNEIHGGGEHFSSLHNDDDLITCGFSSLGRLPLYEVDYGWGRPVWVIPAALIIPFTNQVTFMPTSSGDGMEAWVNLHQEDATFSFTEI